MNEEKRTENLTENKNNAERKNFCHIITEYLTIAVAAIACMLFVFTQVLINAHIPSDSMEDTLMTGDHVIGNRLAYKFGATPQRLDIVIFYAPDEDNVLYIKRIIGTPGDTVEIKGEKVYVNGELLDEPYAQYLTEEVDPGMEEESEEENLTFVVPEGCYFMLGDNRNNSLDSRYWDNPYVEEDQIVAKAVLKYWKNFSLL